jgi:hypothetical protein
MKIHNIRLSAAKINDQPEVTITQNDQCILQNDVIERIKLLKIFTL